MTRVKAVIALAAAFCAATPLASAIAAQATKPAIEPRADQLLKDMSRYLAKQKRLQVEAASQTEVVLKSGQKIEFDSESEVSLQRPNKLRSDRRGMVARDLSFYYDGKTISLFGRELGYYASTPAPGTIDEAIDFARQRLDLEAPGADLLGSDPYRDLTEDVVSGEYIGKTELDGIIVHQLAFRGHETDWQIWIRDGEKPLPMKYVIISKNVTGQPGFSVMLRDWDLSPSFSKKTFAFKPPSDAARATFAGVPESAPKGKG